MLVQRLGCESTSPGVRRYTSKGVHKHQTRLQPQRNNICDEGLCRGKFLQFLERTLDDIILSFGVLEMLVVSASFYGTLSVRLVIPKRLLWGEQGYGVLNSDWQELRCVQVSSLLVSFL